MEAWQQRAAEAVGEALAWSGGMIPEQAFEHHVANPNLFRTLAKRLSDFSIYAKMSGAPMLEGEIGPDCARAALLFAALADVVEESRK